ncbi:uncharacterized protein LOC132549900 isoform X2 [Ylistrum balloti]|uniref:uncharacterized protein LOC132549900 isoform X2 n=1 Tax=Ylistrum balloti TaxID=509963 RepID=UPI002905E4E2|nr:uncharacterized protein LOC132549900 isoform X2 [Ylistrum balloti]
MATATQLVRIGDECLQDKNYDMAISAYSSALNIGVHSGQTEVLKKRSNCYFQICSYDCAYDDIIEVQKTSPKWIAGYRYAANCLSNLGDVEGVCELYTKGLELNSGSVDLKNGLAEAKTKMARENTEATSNNPLSIYKLDYYPGDDVRLKEEKEKRDSIDNVKIQTEGRHTKDQSVLELVRESWKHQQNGELQKASQSLQTAVTVKPDVTYLRQVLGEIYFRLDRYEDAFRCLNAIPSSMRSFDTWIIGGQVLQKLGLPVSAEMWLRYAEKVGGKRGERASILFHDVRSRRLYQDVTTDKHVEVRFREKGRALFAKQDIGKGKLIFNDKPILLAQTNDSSGIRACSFCAKTLQTAQEYFGKDVLENNKTLKEIVETHWPKCDVISCLHCDREFYCSDICRKSAWEQHHQILCISVNESMMKLYDVCDKYKKLIESNQRIWEDMWNAAFSPMLLARLWAAIVCEVKRQAKGRGVSVPETRDWIRAKLPFRSFALRRYIAFAQCSYAQMVPNMVKIMREIFSNAGTGVVMEISEKEFDCRYFQIACNVQAFSDPNPPFVIFKRNAKSAGLEVTQFMTKDEKFATFGGLFCLHASMNHSCDNNADVHDGAAGDNPGVHVIANRAIKRGEEINITYIDTTMARQNRRAWLIRSYNFWCLCPRCRFEGDDSGVCTNCNKAATKDKPFLGCGKCRSAWYCSPQCQKSAWKRGHKTICRKR